ncbi:hypothetical protein QAD02_013554 [Eretmocerus hayati]|uniref:Uncharacterized protein n=1 Tax=Eretmocerus hayati TaxID=131215 RepID=A0ACC2P305_9HYME|nr:hypothetical protein QAD02_013554 [Eretmocerus hayati]
MNIRIDEYRRLRLEDKILDWLPEGMSEYYQMRAIDEREGYYYDEYSKETMLEKLWIAVCVDEFENLIYDLVKQVYYGLKYQFMLLDDRMARHGYLLWADERQVVIYNRLKSIDDLVWF